MMTNLFPAVKCGNPMELTNAIVAMGYIDPALKGQNITFACLPGQTLNGSNSSICMGNGEWEPDPTEVACTSTAKIIGTTFETTMIGNVTLYMHVMMMYVYDNNITYVSVLEPIV
jgi:hypothetical protein